MGRRADLHGRREGEGSGVKADRKGRCWDRGHHPGGEGYGNSLGEDVKGMEVQSWQDRVVEMWPRGRG